MADKSSGNFTPHGGHPVPGHYLTGPENSDVGDVLGENTQPENTPKSAPELDEPDSVADRHPWDLLR